MINCKFQLNADNLWQCPDCGWVYPRKADKPPRRNCPAKQPAYTQEQLNKMRAEEGDFYGVPPTAAQQAEAAEQQKKQRNGPGTQLHRILKQLTGEEIERGCKCRGHIAAMNQRGPKWCRANLDTIIDWLNEEITRRKKDKPNLAVKLASWNLPGQRLAMKRMILLAVKRAERNTN